MANKSQISSALISNAPLSYYSQKESADNGQRIIAYSAAKSFCR